MDESSSSDVVVVNDDSKSAFPNEAWIGVAAGVALIIVVLAIMITCVIRKRSSKARSVNNNINKNTGVQRKMSLTVPSPAYAPTKAQFPGNGGDTLPLPGGYGWGTMDQAAVATVPGYREPGFDVPDDQSSHVYSELTLRAGGETLNAYSSGQVPEVPTAARIYLTSNPPSSGVSTANRDDTAGAGVGVPLYGDVPAQNQMVSFVNRYADDTLLKSKSKN